MAKTFLDLTNEIIDEVNEVRLTAANFADARNIQRFAKTCINRAYRDMHIDEYKWPWTADTSLNDYLGNQTITTVAGQRWYLAKTGSSDENTDFADIDRESFTLTEEGASGATTPYQINNLKVMSVTDWKRWYAVSEKRDDTGEQVYGIPQRVIMNPDNRYIGLSPIPDKEYKVYFYAWNQITELDTYDDTIIVPDRFAHVLLAKARYHLWKFKENESKASAAEKEFKHGLRRMKEAVAPFPEYMTDDRIRRV
jgi:hypothetical protein